MKNNNQKNIAFFEDYKRIVEGSRLSVERICIVGSATLAHYGVRENADVDFIMTEVEATTGFPAGRVYDFTPKVQLLKYGWLTSKGIPISDDEIIANNEYHFLLDDMFKVARLELVYAFKKKRGREKDIRDIKLIEEKKKSLPWDESLYKRIYDSSE